MREGVEITILAIVHYGLAIFLSSPEALEGAAAALTAIGRARIGSLLGVVGNFLVQGKRGSQRGAEAPSTSYEKGVPNTQREIKTVTKREKGYIATAAFIG